MKKGALSGFRRSVRRMLQVLVLPVCVFLLVTYARAAREWVVKCDENYSQCGWRNLPDSRDNTDGMISEMDDELSIWSQRRYS